MKLVSRTAVTHNSFFALFPNYFDRHISILSCFPARKLWRDYFASGVDGVVFIVDAVDKERFPEAKRELDVSRSTDRLNVIPFYYPNASFIQFEGIFNELVIHANSPLKRLMT